jgi:hypothetical protein
MGNFFDGFRVRMQPQTTHANTAAKKIQSCGLLHCGVLRRLTPPYAL